MKILDKIKKGESEILEFKREIPKESEKFLKTVSAFANAKGGKIIFGIDDKTQEIVGINGDIAKLKDDIANIVNDSIEPQIYPKIWHESFDKKDIIVLEIKGGDRPPYFFKSKKGKEKTFVRVGATSREADFYTIVELKLRGTKDSFDTKECEELANDADNFNDEKTRELCQKIQKRIENSGKKREVTPKILENFGILKNINGKFVPTNAYAILQMSGPFGFCGIQCATFRGREKSLFLDKLDCSGTLFEQVEQALIFVKRNIKVGVKFVGIQGLDDFEIPVSALREGIVNAAVHRSYMENGETKVVVFDDRIEVVSPGRLVAGLSVKSAMSGTSVSRNLAVARVFREMNFMEEWGSGFRRMQEECEKANLKPPKFYEKENECLLVFERRVENRDEELLCELGKLNRTIKEFSKQIGQSEFIKNIKKFQETATKLKLQNENIKSLSNFKQNKRLQELQEMMTKLKLQNENIKSLSNFKQNKRLQELQEMMKEIL